MTTHPSTRIKISHTGFCIAFSVLLYVTCNALNIAKLARWFYGKEGLDYAGLLSYLLAGLCVCIAFCALLAHRPTLKPLAFVLTVASATVTYFISKYDVAIDSSMVLNAIHTDVTEVRQLLSLQMLPYAVLLILFPLMLILRVEITFKPPRKYLLSSLGLISVTLTVAIACLYSNYDSILRAGNVSKKYIVYSLVPLNFLSGTLNALAGLVKPYLERDPTRVVIPGRVSSPGNLVVVLAIGEASRRKSFSIYGYDRRNTNPVLGRITGLHLLNGIATRGTTLYALPKILEKEGVKLPLMASRLGIPTACYVNFTLYDNCAGVGETRAKNCGHGGRCYDEDVVPLLQENLRTYVSGYRFIVLHLGGGSHGPIYTDRYPPEFQKFKPVCADADVANRCTLEQLYNSYDNSILYVDHVLGRIIRTLDVASVPYVFLYVSDHGESLLEGGRMFHGMPPGIALPPEQAQIPLLVKSSVRISIVGRAEYPQSDVFDTVMGLFSIQTPLFDSRGSFIRKDSAYGF
jgi:lipid A ethanolaminephosphotransferase